MGAVKDLQDRIGENVKKAAQRNLGATYTRFHIRAKWRNGKPISYVRKAYKGKIDNSGTLRKSLDYQLTEMGVKWSMAGYGYYVEEGRKGIRRNKHLSGKGKKGIPDSALRKYMRSKPVRARDADGKFVKQTESRMRSLRFMINRKIKWFGIDATRFFSEPFYEVTKDYAMKYGDAFMEDNGWL